MLSPSACRNLGVCFLLNLVENLYNMPQSGGSYFGLITPEPTPSYHQATLHFCKGPGRTSPSRPRSPRGRQRLPALPDPSGAGSEPGTPSQGVGLLLLAHLAPAQGCCIGTLNHAGKENSLCSATGVTASSD